MPSIAGRGLFAKYGTKLDTAVKKHASTPIEFGIVRLPGGITSGIARLTKCGFEQFKQGTTQKRADGQPAIGEYYFRAEGSIIEPDRVTTPEGVVTVKGLQTSIIIPICDTKNSKGDVTTTEDHVRVILNHIKMLTSEEFVAGVSARDLEELTAKVTELGPYFRFSTSASKPSEEYPNPQVFQNWHGNKGLDDYVPPNFSQIGMGDTTSRTDTLPSNGESKSTAPPITKTREIPRKELETAMNKQSPAQRERVAPLKKEEETKPFNEFEDEEQKSPDEDSQEDKIEILLQTTKSEDEKEAGIAGNQLFDMAMAAGYTKEEVEAPTDWEGVVELIRNPKESGTTGTSEPDEVEGAPDEGEDPAIPSLGDEFKYKPVDPKTGKYLIDPRTKREKKPIDVEVVKVNKEKGTCTLCSSIDRKVLFKDVKFDELIGE